MGVLRGSTEDWGRHCLRSFKAISFGHICPVIDLSLDIAQPACGKAPVTDSGSEHPQKTKQLETIGIAS